MLNVSVNGVRIAASPIGKPSNDIWQIFLDSQKAGIIKPVDGGFQYQIKGRKGDIFPTFSDCFASVAGTDEEGQ